MNGMVAGEGSPPVDEDAVIAAEVERGKRRKAVARARAWARANPDRVREIFRKAGRKWAAANPDKVRAKALKQTRKNPEKNRARARAWAAANPERHRARSRDWSKANLAKVRELQAERRNINRSKGLCRCGRAMPQKGFRSCRLCKEESRNLQREARQKRREAGLCLHCREKAEPERTLCAKHIKATGAAAARYAKKKAASRGSFDDRK